MTTAAGAVPVRAPPVNDKRVDPDTGERQRLSSAILPACPASAEVLPLLCLLGLSWLDFVPALEQFLGRDAGLSAATITRLTRQWQDGATVFDNRSRAGTDDVYVWVDGTHPKVRLEQHKVRLLVMIGVRADGTKSWSRSTTGTASPPSRGRTGAKWPKAVAKINGDLDVLLAFYAFPAEHWVHLRTTNPIESTLATVRLRQRVTKGPSAHDRTLTRT